MLKGLDPLLDGDLLKVLRDMGHGDELVIVDRNFPADSVARATATGRAIRQDAADAARMARAIFSLLPLDAYVAAPIRRMEVIGDPEAMTDVHKEVLAEAEAAHGGPVVMGGIERFAFYEAAKRAYAVVATAENRPFGNFLISKGVIFD